MTRLAFILILLAGCQAVPTPVVTERMAGPGVVLWIPPFVDCMGGPGVEVFGECIAYDRNSRADRQVDLGDHMRLTASRYPAPITGHVMAYKPGVHAGLTLEGEIVSMAYVPGTGRHDWRIAPIRASDDSWVGIPSFWTRAQWAEIRGGTPGG